MQNKVKKKEKKKKKKQKTTLKHQLLWMQF